MKATSLLEINEEEEKQVTLAVKQYKWYDQRILRHETKSYQHDFCK